MADSRNRESIEIIENIEKKLQKQMAKIVLEAWIIRINQNNE